MNRYDDLLNRLARKATQQTPVNAADAEPPYGFTTRVLAKATAQRPAGWLASWESLAAAALPAAAAVLVICWLAVPRVQGARVLDTSESLASAMIECALPR